VFVPRPGDAEARIPGRTRGGDRVSRADRLPVGERVQRHGFTCAYIIAGWSVRTEEPRWCRPAKGGNDRQAPLPDAVGLLLSAHIAEHPPAGIALPWRALDGKPATVKLLFTTMEGRAITQTPFTQKHWHPALHRAGLAVKRQNGFHALRHYFASALPYDGVDIRALAVYLGHHDPAFTLRVYAHLVPDAADRMRAVIDKAARTEADGPVTALGVSQ
jgi:integrase